MDDQQPFNCYAPPIQFTPSSSLQYLHQLLSPSRPESPSIPPVIYGTSPVADSPIPIPSSPAPIHPVCDMDAIDFATEKEYDQHISHGTVAQEKDQKRVFTDWINYYVPGCIEDDLIGELKDGTKLLTLLENLTGQKLPREKEVQGRGRRLHSISNVNTALNVLKQRKAKMVNLNAADIVDGNHAIIMGLVWTIILQFHDKARIRSGSVNSLDGCVYTKPTRVSKPCDYELVTNSKQLYRDALEKGASQAMSESKHENFTQRPDPPRTLSSVTQIHPSTSPSSATQLSTVSSDSQNELESPHPEKGAATLSSEEKEDVLLSKLLHLMSITPLSYSLVVTYDECLYAIRDPFGNRPLSIGMLFIDSQTETPQEMDGWVVSTESDSFSSISAKLWRDLEPGEIVKLERNKLPKILAVVPAPRNASNPSKSHEPPVCVMEHVYFDHSDAGNEGQISSAKSGRQLSIEPSLPILDDDAISQRLNIPAGLEKAIPAARTFASQAGVPFVEVFSRKRYIGRTFIQPLPRPRKTKGTFRKADQIPPIPVLHRSEQSTSLSQMEVISEQAFETDVHLSDETASNAADELNGAENTKDQVSQEPTSEYSMDQDRDSLKLCSETKAVGTDNECHRTAGTILLDGGKPSTGLASAPDVAFTGIGIGLPVHLETEICNTSGAEYDGSTIYESTCQGIKVTTFDSQQSVQETGTSVQPDQVDGGDEIGKANMFATTGFEDIGPLENRLSKSRNSLLPPMATSKPSFIEPEVSGDFDSCVEPNVDLNMNESGLRDVPEYSESNLYISADSRDRRVRFDTENLVTEVGSSPDTQGVEGSQNQEAGEPEIAVDIVSLLDPSGDTLHTESRVCLSNSSRDQQINFETEVPLNEVQHTISAANPVITTTFDTPIDLIVQHFPAKHETVGVISSAGAEKLNQTTQSIVEIDDSIGTEELLINEDVQNIERSVDDLPSDNVEESHSATVHVNRDTDDVCQQSQGELDAKVSEGHDTSVTERVETTSSNTLHVIVRHESLTVDDNEMYEQTVSKVVRYRESFDASIVEHINIKESLSPDFPDSEPGESLQNDDEGLQTIVDSDGKSSEPERPINVVTCEPSGHGDRLGSIEMDFQEPNGDDAASTREVNDGYIDVDYVMHSEIGHVLNEELIAPNTLSTTAMSNDISESRISDGARSVSPNASSENLRSETSETSDTRSEINTRIDVLSDRAQKSTINVCADEGESLKDICHDQSAIQVVNHIPHEGPVVCQPDISVVSQHLETRETGSCKVAQVPPSCKLFDPQLEAESVLSRLIPTTLDVAATNISAIEEADILRVAENVAIASGNDNCCDRQVNNSFQRPEYFTPNESIQILEKASPHPSVATTKAFDVMADNCSIDQGVGQSNSNDGVSVDQNGKNGEMMSPSVETVEEQHEISLQNAPERDVTQSEDLNEDASQCAIVSDVKTDHLVEVDRLGSVPNVEIPSKNKIQHVIDEDDWEVVEWQVGDHLYCVQATAKTHVPSTSLTENDHLLASGGQQASLVEIAVPANDSVSEPTKLSVMGVGVRPEGSVLNLPAAENTTKIKKTQNIDRKPGKSSDDSKSSQSRGMIRELVEREVEEAGPKSPHLDPEIISSVVREIESELVQVQSTDSSDSTFVNDVEPAQTDQPPCEENSEHVDQSPALKCELKISGDVGAGTDQCQDFDTEPPNYLSELIESKVVATDRLARYLVALNDSYEELSALIGGDKCKMLTECKEMEDEIRSNLSASVVTTGEWTSDMATRCEVAIQALEDTIKRIKESREKEHRQQTAEEGANEVSQPQSLETFEEVTFEGGSTAEDVTVDWSQTTSTPIQNKEGEELRKEEGECAADRMFASSSNQSKDSFGDICSSGSVVRGVLRNGSHLGDESDEEHIDVQVQEFTESGSDLKESTDISSSTSSYHDLKKEYDLKVSQLESKVKMVLDINKRETKKRSSKMSIEIRRTQLNRLLELKHQIKEQINKVKSTFTPEELVALRNTCQDEIRRLSSSSSSEILGIAMVSDERSGMETIKSEGGISKDLRIEEKDGNKSVICGKPSPGPDDAGLIDEQTYPEPSSSVEGNDNVPDKLEDLNPQSDSPVVELINDKRDLIFGQEYFGQTLGESLPPLTETNQTNPQVDQMASCNTERSLLRSSDGPKLKCASGDTESLDLDSRNMSGDYSEQTNTMTSLDHSISEIGFCNDTKFNEMWCSSPSMMRQDDSSIGKVSRQSDDVDAPLADLSIGDDLHQQKGPNNFVIDHNTRSDLNGDRSTDQEVKTKVLRESGDKLPVSGHPRDSHIVLDNHLADFENTFDIEEPVSTVADVPISGEPDQTSYDTRRESKIRPVNEQTRSTECLDSKIHVDDPTGCQRIQLESQVRVCDDQCGVLSIGDDRTSGKEEIKASAENKTTKKKKRRNRNRESIETVSVSSEDGQSGAVAYNNVHEEADETVPTSLQLCVEISSNVAPHNNSEPTGEVTSAHVTLLQTANQPADGVNNPEQMTTLLPIKCVPKLDDQDVFDDVQQQMSRKEGVNACQLSSLEIVKETLFDVECSEGKERLESNRSTPCAEPEFKKMLQEGGHASDRINFASSSTFPCEDTTSSDNDAPGGLVSGSCLKIGASKEDKIDILVQEFDGPEFVQNESKQALSISSRHDMENKYTSGGNRKVLTVDQPIERPDPNLVKPEEFHFSLLEECPERFHPDARPVADAFNESGSKLSVSEHHHGSSDLESSSDPQGVEWSQNQESDEPEIAVDIVSLLDPSSDTLHTESRVCLSNSSRDQQINFETEVPLNEVQHTISAANPVMTTTFDTPIDLIVQHFPAKHETVGVISSAGAEKLNQTTQSIVEIDDSVGTEELLINEDVQNFELSIDDLPSDNVDATVLFDRDTDDVRQQGQDDLDAKISVFNNVPEGHDISATGQVETITSSNTSHVIVHHESLAGDGNGQTVSKVVRYRESFDASIVGHVNIKESLAPDLPDSELGESIKNEDEGLQTVRKSSEPMDVITCIPFGHGGRLGSIEMDPEKPSGDDPASTREVNGGDIDVDYVMHPEISDMLNVEFIVPNTTPTSNDSSESNISDKARSESHNASSSPVIQQSAPLVGELPITEVSDQASNDTRRRSEIHPVNEHTKSTVYQDSKMHVVDSTGCRRIDSESLVQVCGDRRGVLSIGEYRTSGKEEITASGEKEATKKKKRRNRNRKSVEKVSVSTEHGQTAEEAHNNVYDEVDEAVPMSLQLCAEISSNVAPLIDSTDVTLLQTATQPSDDFDNLEQLTTPLLIKCEPKRPDLDVFDDSQQSIPEDEQSNACQLSSLEIFEETPFESENSEMNVRLEFNQSSPFPEPESEMIQNEGGHTTDRVNVASSQYEDTTSSADDVPGALASGSYTKIEVSEEDNTDDGNRKVLTVDQLIKPSNPTLVEQDDTNEFNCSLEEGSERFKPDADPVAEVSITEEPDQASNDIRRESEILPVKEQTKSTVGSETEIHVDDSTGCQRTDLESQVQVCDDECGVLSIGDNRTSDKEEIKASAEKGTTKKKGRRNRNRKSVEKVSDRGELGHSAEVAHNNAEQPDETVPTALQLGVEISSDVAPQINSELAGKVTSANACDSKLATDVTLPQTATQPSDDFDNPGQMMASLFINYEPKLGDLVVFNDVQQFRNVGNDLQQCMLEEEQGNSCQRFSLETFEETPFQGENSDKDVRLESNRSIPSSFLAPESEKIQIEEGHATDPMDFAASSTHSCEDTSSSADYVRGGLANGSNMKISVSIEDNNEIRSPEFEVREFVHNESLQASSSSSSYDMKNEYTSDGNQKVLTDQLIKPSNPGLVKQGDMTGSNYLLLEERSEMFKLDSDPVAEVFNESGSKFSVSEHNQDSPIVLDNSSEGSKNTFDIQESVPLFDGLPITEEPDQASNDTRDSEIHSNEQKVSTVGLDSKIHVDDSTGCQRIDLEPQVQVCGDECGILAIGDDRTSGKEEITASADKETTKKKKRRNRNRKSVEKVSDRGELGHSGEVAHNNVHEEADETVSTSLQLCVEISSNVAPQNNSAPAGEVTSANACDSSFATNVTFSQTATQSPDGVGNSTEMTGPLFIECGPKLDDLDVSNDVHQFRKVGNEFQQCIPEDEQSNACQLSSLEIFEETPFESENSEGNVRLEFNQSSPFPEPESEMIQNEGGHTTGRVNVASSSYEDTSSSADYVPGALASGSFMKIGASKEDIIDILVQEFQDPEFVLNESIRALSSSSRHDITNEYTSDGNRRVSTADQPIKPSHPTLAKHGDTNEFNSSLEEGSERFKPDAEPISVEKVEDEQNEVETFEILYRLEASIVDNNRSECRDEALENIHNKAGKRKTGSNLDVEAIRSYQIHQENFSQENEGSTPPQDYQSRETGRDLTLDGPDDGYDDEEVDDLSDDEYPDNGVVDMNSNKIESPERRSRLRYFTRVIQTSIPLQVLMLALLSAASLVPTVEDDYSCLVVNNLVRSFEPMLNFPDGPPPI